MTSRPTFRDFRVHVAALSNSVGSSLGTCIGDIPALAGLVNVVTQKWLFDPLQPEEGWWFTWQRMVFNVSVSNPYITVPYEFARIILMDVNRRPTKVQNGFYEFLDYGIGLQPRNCSAPQCDGLMQTYDRETTPTLGTLNPGPQTIRVFPTDPRDVGKTTIIQGADQNGNTVLSTDPVTNQTIGGETITLGFPFINSVNQFTSITGMQKDATFGPVQYFQVDSQGNQNTLSTMEANETAGNYRRYLVNNLPCNSPLVGPGLAQVTAMCKLDFVPVQSDPDFLLIPNIPALMLDCEAERFGAMDNVKAQAMADKKHSDALKLLFGQLDHYMGRERPAINVSLFGKRRSLKQLPL